MTLPSEMIASLRTWPTSHALRFGVVPALSYREQAKAASAPVRPTLDDFNSQVSSSGVVASFC